MDPERETADSPSILYDLSFGYAKNESLFAGVELGIFDGLAEKPLTYQELAVKINVSPNHLDKMLNMLCLLKLCDKKYENGKELFFNATTANMYLTKDSEECLIDYVKFTALFKQYTERITEAVRTGKQVVYDEDDNLFYKMNNDQNMRKVFHGGMANISRTSRFLLDAFDLSEFKVHVDLGGSTGTMARNLKLAYPDKEVSVCDLPRVCDLAVEMPVNKEADIKFIHGDFFKGNLPEADMYSMCHVIHDWDDADSHKIFENVFKAVRPGGAVLLLDSVFNDDKVGPPRVNFTEISQIVQHDGKHRTLADFTELLEAHGFTDVQLKRWNGFGFYDAIMARKPKM